jgi:hypothetical protein
MGTSIIIPDSNKNILIGIKSMTAGVADFTNIPAGYTTFLYYFSLKTTAGTPAGLILINNDTTAGHYPFNEKFAAVGATLSGDGTAYTGLMFCNSAPIGTELDGTGAISNSAGLQKTNFVQNLQSNAACYHAVSGLYTETGEINEIKFTAPCSGTITLFGVKQ